jgi:hypothetical protein
VNEFEEPSDFSEPMPCFEFNPSLTTRQDDGRCVHCRKFLTLECPYIGHFVSEEYE